jgi:hypothetical protein
MQVVRQTLQAIGREAPSFSSSTASPINLIVSTSGRWYPQRAIATETDSSAEEKDFTPPLRLSDLRYNQDLNLEQVDPIVIGLTRALQRRNEINLAKTLAVHSLDSRLLAGKQQGLIHDQLFQQRKQRSQAEPEL